jgi:hypothetical protein
VRPVGNLLQALAEHAPWRPVEPTPEQVGAIKAMSRGEALPHQQQAALQFLIDLAYNGGAHYFPGEGGRRDTDFALGRAWVGQQIVTMCKMIVKPGGEQG